MSKRIISATLVACIIVPTFFWGKEMLGSVINVPAASGTISETCQDIIDWFNKQSVKDIDAKIQAEEERLTKAIDEASEILSMMGTEGDAEKISPVKAYVSHLIEERKKLLDRKREFLNELHAKRLVAEEANLDREREKAAQKQWEIAEEVLRIHQSMKRETKRVEENRLAALVNDLFDEVESLDVAAVRERCVAELKPAITRDRLKKAKKALGTADEMEFEIQRAGAAACDVLIDGKKQVGLTRKGNTWYIAHLP